MTGDDEPRRGEEVLYEAEDGDVRVEGLLREETRWGNGKAIAEVVAVKVRGNRKQHKNI